MITELSTLVPGQAAAAGPPLRFPSPPRPAPGLGRAAPTASPPGRQGAPERGGAARAAARRVPARGRPGRRGRGGRRGRLYHMRGAARGRAGSAEVGDERRGRRHGQKAEEQERGQVRAAAIPSPYPRLRAVDSSGERRCRGAESGPAGARGLVGGGGQAGLAGPGPAALGRVASGRKARLCPSPGGAIPAVHAGPAGDGGPRRPWRRR